MHRPTYIYACCEPNTNEVRYIGKTVGKVSSRVKQHLNRKGHSHRNMWFQKVRNPTYFTIEVVPPYHDWQEAEQFWIEYLRSMGARLVNATSGGEGLCGYRFTAEQLERVRAANLLTSTLETRNAKISSALMGHKSYERTPEMLARLGAKLKGRIITTEHRAKISAATKGRKATYVMTDEVKAKISATKKSKVLTDEQRARLANRKGCKCTEEQREHLRQYMANRSDEERAATNAKISEKRKGHTVSEETRRKISEAHKGRKHTAESRANMSSAHKGKPRGKREIKEVVQHG